MATEAQIRANRENAKKSTGPKTPEGKARCAQNARKHGFASRKFDPLELLNPREQEFQLKALSAQYIPKNEAAEQALQILATNLCLTRALERLEIFYFNTGVHGPKRLMGVNFYLLEQIGRFKAKLENQMFEIMKQKDELFVVCNDPNFDRFLKHILKR